MPPKVNLNVNSAPENSSKLKVTAASVPFLCSWIKVLGIWHPIDPKKFHDELQNGLLLCRVTEMLVPGASFPTNKKPLTKSPCIKNLEMALPTIWKKNPSPINMCTAQEFYDMKALTVTRCMLEIFKTLQVQQTRQQASEFLSDLDAGLAPIGRPLSKSTLEKPQTSPELFKDFSDCTRLVAILVMRHKMKPDAVHEFWGHPTTKFQKMQNASALVKALDAARAGGLFTANDWISPPEPCPETLLYVIHYTYQRLRLSKDCWDKDKVDLSDMKFKDGVPLAHPPVLSRPDEDELDAPTHKARVAEPELSLQFSGEPKKSPKKDVLSSPVKSSIAARKSAFVRTAAALDNQGERCIMSPSPNYSQSLAKEKSPQGQALIRVASAPSGFAAPVGSDPGTRDEQQVFGFSALERGVRGASPHMQKAAPSATFALRRFTRHRYTDNTQKGPQFKPWSEQEIRENTIPIRQAKSPQQRRAGGEMERRAPHAETTSQVQLKLRQQENLRQRQQETLRSQNRTEFSPPRRGPGGLAHPHVAFQSPRDPRDARNGRLRMGGGMEESPGDNAADQFLNGISDAIQRIDPYSLGKNWPRHWEEKPRARTFEPLFDEQRSAQVDGKDNGYRSRMGDQWGSGGDFDGFGTAKATPTTRIKAHVVCQDGSTWPARIYTNVVDTPSSDSDSVKMVVDFQACEGGSELRIRVDASYIADIKITQSKGGDGNPAGTSYFVLVQKSGMLVSSNDSGAQYMPMPDNLAVIHVTVNRTAAEAENFFGELLILAQFLNATR